MSNYLPILFVSIILKFLLIIHMSDGFRTASPFQRVKIRMSSLLFDNINLYCLEWTIIIYIYFNNPEQGSLRPRDKSSGGTAEFIENGLAVRSITRFS